MLQNRQPRFHFPALDGLRGVASILVVTYHLFPFLEKYLFFGWMAMDIFFVLSGYLITDILMKTLDEKNYLKNFYARRLLRVFPLYFTTLIFFFIILPNFKNLPINLTYFIDNQIYFWVFLQNWLLILKPSPSAFALNHLWSIGVEEQFYLLWPLVVAFVKKPKTLLIILIVLLVGFSVFRFVLWIDQIKDLAYFSLFTFTRIDGICIGCMVAVLQKINPKFIGKNIAAIVLSFAAFNFLFYFINQQRSVSFPYLGLLGYSTFSMLFGLVVYDIINKQTKIISWLLDNSLLKFFGRVSYGTYIFHWPLYLLINPFLVQWAAENIKGFSPQIFSSLTAMLLSYFLGYLSYRFFEMKFLNLKKHFV